LSAQLGIDRRMLAEYRPKINSLVAKIEHYFEEEFNAPMSALELAISKLVVFGFFEQKLTLRQLFNQYTSTIDYLYLIKGAMISETAIKHFIKNKQQLIVADWEKLNLLNKVGLDAQEFESYLLAFSKSDNEFIKSQQVIQQQQ